MILFGEEHLRGVVDEHLEFYHRERNHQGLDGPILQPALEVGAANAKVRRRQRFGGMLNFYCQDAA